VLVSDILSETLRLRDLNDKKSFLRCHSNNKVLRHAIRMGSDPFMHFHVSNVPDVTFRNPLAFESDRWALFFYAAGRCASREVAGSKALDVIGGALTQATAAEEAWMRKILNKDLGIGVPARMIREVFPGLVSTREVPFSHEAAERLCQNSYRDPETGYHVLTRSFLLSRGRCCGSGCRHCPYEPGAPAGADPR